MFDILKAGYEPKVDVPQVNQPEPQILTSDQIQEI